MTVSGFGTPIRYAPTVGEILDLERAQSLVLAHAKPLASERVALSDALGRVTAAAVRATVDLPPFASSAMDGFAVRSADVPGVLRVVGEAAAGRPADAPLGHGETVAISTGGVVPASADAVIPIEYVVKHDNDVEIAEGVAPGAHVRPRGGDVAAGDVVVPGGTRLGPAQLGALGAAGVAHVECARRPRVAVLATGSELVRPGTPLADGQIYESNSLMLSAAVTAAGCDIELLPLVADDERAHRDALARGLQADVLVTSGGVSVGPHDLVRSIEAELGVVEIFWRVAIKPGKPVSFGVRDATLVFGLPGNPVSSLVGCELFVKPALRALQGEKEPLPRFEAGVVARELRQNDARDEFVRAGSRLDQNGDRIGTVLEPLTGQESHMIVRAAAADALIHVPRGEGTIPEGAAVRWLRLGYS
jgi:molybdopterin molybdotransferase